MRAATDAAASAPPPLLLTEPFETDVLVQVDLVAPAPVTPDDELATAPLIEQLPEVVKLPEPPLAEKRTGRTRFCNMCYRAVWNNCQHFSHCNNSSLNKIGFVHLRKTGYSSL